MESPAPPPGGEPALLKPWFEALSWRNYGTDKTLGASETVPVEGMPFDRAQRVTVKERGNPFYFVAAGTGALAPVQKGDTLLLRVWLRLVETTHESAQGRVYAYLQQSQRPFNPSLLTPVDFGKTWQRFDLPFQVTTAYAPGAAILSFGAAERKQVVELGGVELLNYHNKLGVTDLPRTRVNYDGREPGAPWRQAAAARIETLRKGDLRVQVTDAAGAPVPGAKVAVRMQRHAFAFGTAIGNDEWLRQDETGAKFRQSVTSLFNTVSVENGLKWKRWETPAEQEKTLRVLREVKAAGMNVHGHVLVWPSFTYSRVDLTKERGNPAALRERINRHIRDITGATRDLVDEWDVINEPWNNHDFMDILGRDEMTAWFKLAREGAPQARLFINDFGILVSPEPETDGHVAQYETNIRLLLDQHAPIQAIGMQGHFGGAGNAVPIMQRTLDRFAATGLSLAITEYDFDTQDEELQADFTRDLMTLLFSHPAVDRFIMWGFWDGAHWRNNAPVFRRDWSLKPSGKAYRDLVFGAWWTTADLETGKDGAAVARGFLGDYEVTVTAPGGRRAVKTVRLEKSGVTLPVVLP